MNAPIEWLNWPAPDSVKACFSLRKSGRYQPHSVSSPPFDEFNYALHVGDVPEVVKHNRQGLSQTIKQTRIQWLEQVHGIDIVQASINESKADATYTNQLGQVCAVMTADCLPVFFCDQAGSQVAVAHAGWRGLAAGILQQTLKRFAKPEEVLVYLGPAISQSAFEVGDEVRAVFTQQLPALETCFKAKDNHKWMADLYSLARLLLAEQSVSLFFGGDRCTFDEPDAFYSYRRDGQTGRMANLIWLV